MSALTDRDTATLARVLSSIADSLNVDYSLALAVERRSRSLGDAYLARQCWYRVQSVDRAALFVARYAPSQLARQAVLHAALVIETGPGRCSTRRRQAMRLASLADKLVTR